MTRETEEEFRPRIQFLESILRDIDAKFGQAGVSSTERSTASHWDERELLGTLTPKAQRTLEHFLFGY